MQTNIMLDLETLSTSPRAVILQIGAVAFDPALGPYKPHFSTTINIQSCLDVGLEVSGETLKWWLSPELAEARPRVFAEEQTLAGALEFFRIWLSDTAEQPSKALIWAGPSNFDLPILRNAYRAKGLTAPWAWYNERCYTTLRQLRPDMPRIKPDLAHDALSDALAQAKHACALLRAIAERPPTVYDRCEGKD